MRTLYWIDDTHDSWRPPRAPARLRLEERLGVSLRIASIKDRAQFGEVLKKIGDTQPLGVIMDYQLTGVGTGGQMAYGSSWAAEIRAANPSVPVIGISHEREKDIPLLRLESFLAFFPRDQLLANTWQLDNLLALLVGFAAISEEYQKRPKSTGSELLKDLIKPPTTIAALLDAAIPPSIRGSWDVESPHSAGRWLWHEFQARPGFLFDELGLATHLGLTVDAIRIRRIGSLFDPARYQGAFASNARPRWWVAQIRDIFEKVVGAAAVGPLANSRDLLLRTLKIRKSGRSQLLARVHGRKTSEAIPDCVAYRDDEREEGDRVQALFEQTSIDSRDLSLPFGFEARRIYGSNEKR